MGGTACGHTLRDVRVSSALRVARNFVRTGCAFGADRLRRSRGRDADSARTARCLRRARGLAAAYLRGRCGHGEQLMRTQCVVKVRS